MKLNWYYIGLAIVLYMIGQTAVVSTQLQFKDPTKSPHGGVGMLWPFH